MTTTQDHRNRNRVVRRVMWGLIVLFSVISVAVVVMQLDPAIMGRAAGIFIIGCLLLCAGMAIHDAHQSRITELMITPLRIKRATAGGPSVDKDEK